MHDAVLVLWTFLSRINVFLIYPGIYIVYHTSNVSAQWCYDRLIYKIFSIDQISFKFWQYLSDMAIHTCNSYMYLEKKKWTSHIVNILIVSPVKLFISSRCFCFIYNFFPRNCMHVMYIYWKFFLFSLRLKCIIVIHVGCLINFEFIKLLFKNWCRLVGINQIETRLVHLISRWKN